MPRETSYTDPITGERLPSNNPAYTYDPNYLGKDEYVDPVTGEVMARPVPLNHATVSEINELKMSLVAKHEGLAGAVGRLNQAMTPAEFEAAKAEVVARSADIRNTVQGFRA